MATLLVVDKKMDGIDDAFLWRVMNCWGWSTWADRWRFYKKDTEYLLNTFTQQDILHFNLDGCEDFCFYS